MLLVAAGPARLWPAVGSLLLLPGSGTGRPLRPLPLVAETAKNLCRLVAPASSPGGLCVPPWPGGGRGTRRRLRAVRRN